MVSCSGEEKAPERASSKNPEQNQVQEDVIISDVPNNSKDVIIPDSIDLDMDISNLSLSTLRLMRSSILAAQGYCFMEADLRGYFSQTNWYEEMMNNRYWDEDAGRKLVPIGYTKEEQAFVERVEKGRQS